MRNDMYQSGERYVSSDMHQVLKIKWEMMYQKGERYASSAKRECHSWSQKPSVIKLGIGVWNFKCA